MSIKITKGFNENQLDMLDKYNNSKDAVIVGEYKRQAGKTWGSIAILIEDCLNIPQTRSTIITIDNTRFDYIINKTIQSLVKDLEIKPIYNEISHSWKFSNGSFIKLISFTKLENARGTQNDIIVIEEAGFIEPDLLEYALHGLVFPSLITSANPKLIMFSSKPKRHPFDEYLRK